MLDTPATQEKTRPTHDLRRDQLIDAAIQAIAECGLSRVTLSRVAGLAGLTAGMVNFHFKSKEELLRASLRKVADEFNAACETALAAAGPTAAARLIALSRAALDPKVATPEKLTVWYAFWGEVQARDDYMEICGSTEAAYKQRTEDLIAELVAQTGNRIDARVAALGLYGIIDGATSDIILGHRNRRDAIRDCLHYLRNLFPEQFNDPDLLDAPASTAAHAPGGHDGADPDYPDRLTLPAWTYCSEGFTRDEIETIHMPAWHIACHVSEIAAAGDYVTLNALGKRLLVIRGEDGRIRAFHNVCRHRAHEVVKDRSGNCGGLLRCPYHAWTYDTCGVLKGIAASRTFPKLDKDNLGLFPIESEVFLGFVFIRLRQGGPSVAERYAPYESLLAPHAIEDMVPIADLWECEIRGDWKNVWDNYLEDYHFPTGHPGLSALMGKDYDREPDPRTRTVRLSHQMRERIDAEWSARMYARTLPECAHLPESQRRRWSYYFLYPAVSIETYPDMVDFVHVMPIGPGRSLMRWRAYGRGDADRKLKAARWLNRRINLGVHFEDSALVESVQRNLEAGVYERGVLGDKEVNVRAFHDWVREDLPTAR